MIAFMSQYWWGNTKPQKMHTLLLPPVQNTTNGNLFILLPDIINCLMDDSRSGKWLSYNFLHLMDISMF